MIKVYIVNRGGHNYDDAERFGQLVFCTEGSIDKLDTSQIFRELTDSFEGSHPEDYILLMSLASLCSVACAMFAAKHNTLNLLVHTNDGYVARHLNLKDKHDKRVTRAKLLSKER